MLRVLLVLEDYSEMLFLQTLLKKMGFDVEGVQNPRMLNDTILSLNPEILVMTAFGKRVNGFDLSQNLRRPRGLPKVILMHPQGTPTPPANHVEGWLISPSSAMDFLRHISQVGGLDFKQIEDKYQRLTTSQQHVDELDRIHVTSNILPEAPAPGFSPDKAREERQALALAGEARPKSSVFNRKQIEDNVKELRKTEDPVRMASLEKERQAFVKELFKKKA